MQEILSNYYAVDAATADRVAELLGCDPALVLPHLQSQNAAPAGPVQGMETGP